MAIPLRVLIVEDSDSDAGLILDHLEKSGYDPVGRRVETLAQLKTALQEQTWDVVIVDYRMPAAGLPAILALLHDIALDLPVMVVSDTADEKVVVDLLRAGICGYLMKDRLACIGLLVRRELNLAQAASERKVAQAALAESEERYRNYIENTPYGIFVVDEDGRCVYVNAAACQLSGYDEAELAGMRLYYLIPHESLEQGAQYFREVVEQGKCQGELIFRHRSGEKRWWRITAVRLSATRFIGFCSDVTDRRQVERALSLYQDLIQLLNTCDDLKQALVAVLDAALQLEGVDCGGVYLADPLSGDLDLFAHRGLSAQFVDHVAHYSASSLVASIARSGQIRFGRYAEMAVGSDAIRDQEGLRSLAFLPILHQGQLIASLNLASRTYDRFPKFVCRVLETMPQQIGSALLRIRSNEALRAGEARFRATVEQSFDGILIADQEFRIVEWNLAQTAICGFQRDEILGRYLWDYQFMTLPDEQKSQVYRDTLRQSLLHLRTQDTRDWMGLLRTLQIQSKDGERKTLQVSSFPIETPQGRLYGAITRDVTSSLLAEQNYQTLFREMLDGLALHEVILDEQGNVVDYRFLTVNPAFERMTGLRAADIVGKTVLEVMPDTERYWIDTYGRVALTGEPAFFENYSGGTGGKYFEVTAFRPAPRQFVCIFADITQRKQAELELKAAYAKLEALWSVTSLEGADIRQISDHILITLVRMTGSGYGFYGFVNEDETIMTIHSWSGEAMKDCSIVDKPQHFSVAMSGVWAEAIRRREPLILNQYAADHPAKCGLPDGHVPLTNLLVVPYFSHGKITAVAAVANRPAEYTQDDVTQISAFLGSVQAVVDSKRSEEALRESEARFKAVSEYSHNAICLIDESGKIIWMNDAFLQMGGYSRQRICEAGSFAEFLAPESIDFVVSNFLKFARREEYEHHYSFYFLHASGEKRLCEKHMTDYEDKFGKRILAISMVDITERRQAEEALRKSEERYHLIDEASQDRIYSYDRQSRFTHANSSLCRALGLRPEQIIGKTHAELGFPPAQCEEWARLHQRVYETNAAVIAETSTPPLGGGAVEYFEVVLSPMHDASGAIVGIAGTTRDITARKLAEMQIAQQLDELRRWYAITLGREERILELKDEVNRLLAEAGRPHRYGIQEGV